ncbi:MAG: hypothetical protein Q8L21_00415 [Candidatus Komeilibacteria bacterium]|nr:hypothetical protein [Candidatus Komeilibacteria bacterium]
MYEVDPVRNLESRASAKEVQTNPDDISNKGEQFHLANRLRQIQAQARARMKLAEQAESKSKIQGAVDKYKNIKKIIQAVKIASAVGTSIGDIFVSLGMFIITAHGELIYAKFINKNYPIASWEKWFVVVVDIIIILMLTGLFVLIYKTIELLDSLGVTTILNLVK